MNEETTRQLPEGIRPEVMTYEDIKKAAPFLDGHPKIVNALLKWIGIDKVNKIHSAYCDTPGVEFAQRLIHDEFHFKLRVDNEDVLGRFPEGPFITVSNHPFGSYDGILLIDIVGKYRPDYKVMVNLILDQITAMRPNFIAVDPLQSDDPEKKKITMQGIRDAIKHVRQGHPLGFFPAGAISKVQKNLRIEDREWQPSVMRLIQQLQVPVIPIYFHGHNSVFFNVLGLIDWRLRTLHLPRELFRKYGTEVRVSVGEPVSVEEQRGCGSLEELTKLLRGRTYALAR